MAATLFTRCHSHAHYRGTAAPLSTRTVGPGDRTPWKHPWKNQKECIVRQFVDLCRMSQRCNSSSNSSSLHRQLHISVVSRLRDAAAAAGFHHYGEMPALRSSATQAPAMPWLWPAHWPRLRGGMLPHRWWSGGGLVLVCGLPAAETAPASRARARA